ncbi:MAG: rod shape-determining protein [Eubacteriales bacterium]|nr:rod shape-determining protein [Eubacteriales bacterium]MDD4390052.1 rod shape-determining protein [Eubacteriales bacterium]
MFFGLGTKDMGIDLGTANTLIYMKEKNVVLNEPSVIAKDIYSGNIIAVGESAKLMLGKAPSSISVVRPLQDGVISDFDMTAEMLKAFIRKALPDTKSKLRIVIGVPSGVTEVEKRAVEEVARNMGAIEVYILDEPMAAAMGAGLAVDEPTGCMIVDIGGGTSDIAVIAIGGIVASTSLRYAGDKFNEAIIAYMRKNYNLLIGEKTAEQLKINIGYAMLDFDADGREMLEYMDARGRDTINGLPSTISVSNRDMFYALEESVNTIIDGIKSTLEKTSPEIAADIAVNGLILSGGGALLKNLDKVIEQKTNMNVSVSENAFEAVALGAGSSLKDIEKLKRYANSKMAEKYR